MTTRMTSRQFNQDAGGAKRAAAAGPVYITDRGRPSWVLMSFADYLKLTSTEPRVIDLLGEPRGIEEIEFEAPRYREPARPVDFD